MHATLNYFILSLLDLKYLPNISGGKETVFNQSFLLVVYLQRKSLFVNKTVADIAITLNYVERKTAKAASSRIDIIDLVNINTTHGIHASS